MCVFFSPGKTNPKNIQNIKEKYNLRVPTSCPPSMFPQMFHFNRTKCQQTVDLHKLAENQILNIWFHQVQRGRQQWRKPVNFKVWHGAKHSNFALTRLGLERQTNELSPRRPTGENQGMRKNTLFFLAKILKASDRSAEHAKIVKFRYIFQTRRVFLCFSSTCIFPCFCVYPSI